VAVSNDNDNVIKLLQRLCYWQL